MTARGVVALGDLNNDSQVDVVYSGRARNELSVFLNETETDFVTDSNSDGVFDQLDIVQVLQSASYLTGESAIASQGDWNGDGVFDQLDIVRALTLPITLPSRPDSP